MTHPTYTQQALSHYNLPRLKRIAAELGVKPTGDKRASQTWSSAIISHQSAQVKKVDEQAQAQLELNSYIEEQAQKIAPEPLSTREPLTTVEINSNHFEIYAGKWLVAYITYDYDEFVTQPWVVMVSGEEKFRHNTQARCLRYIEWHHLDGTLNPQPQAEVPEVPFISEICFYDQEALMGGELVASINYSHDEDQNPYWQVIINDLEIFKDSTPARCHSYIKQQYQANKLPIQEPFEEPSTTGNEIISEIYNECEKLGFELLDDGVYKNDTKLGSVGYTDGSWWFIRADNPNLEPVFCDSPVDAVWWLSRLKNPPVVKSIDQHLQYQPIEQMTPDQLRYLLDVGEFVAA